MTKNEFKTLFDGHFDSVRSYIYYRCGDTDLATDIAQDVFLRIWEKQIHIDKTRPVSLLFKIARDMFVSSFRRKKVEMNFINNLERDPQEGSPEEKLEYKELEGRYNKALADLPEKQRIVFLMSRIENLKYYEIAERLGISVKAVEKRMKNALSFVRISIQE